MPVMMLFPIYWKEHKTKLIHQQVGKEDDDEEEEGDGDDEEHGEKYNKVADTKGQSRANKKNNSLKTTVK